MMVVDECAIEHDASVRLQCAGQEVCRVDGRATVLRRACATLGISLDGETAEVGDDGVDLIDFVRPPLDHARIERVEGGEAANALGARDVHRESKLYAPRAERRSQAGEFMDMLRGQEVE